jgi:endonuclease G, mitochondrial
MKRILTLVLILINLLCYSQDNKFLPSINNGILIKHDHYILSYVDKYKQSEWVCYELTKIETKNNTERRKGNFMMDPLIKTIAVTHEDYTNSGYDRGHLAPAGDMNFNANAEFESFYTSNISPQLKELNRITWKNLEDDIRYYVIRNNVNLYIITGGILNDKLKKIKNKISVPNYFYKIIYDEKNNKMLAFIIPNEISVNNDYFIYVTSVDNIESETNINFFNNIKNENILEKNIENVNWLKLKN